MIYVPENMKITVPNKNITATVEFSDESPKTVDAILKNLPITGSVNTWGEEIYFNIGVVSELESNARAEVKVGDVAYWDSGTAFCIFFGPTPASSGENPAAVSPVNVLGKVIDIDPKKFLEVDDGDEILLEKV